MIDPDAQRDGHRYSRGEARCGKCSEIATREMGRPIMVLACDFDDEE